MTKNLTFTSRHLFMHVLQEGRVLTLQVDSTKKEIRFHFSFSPPLRTLRDLEEIAEEFMEFRDFWLGKGDDMVRHGIKDFLFYQSCEAELHQLLETLPP